MPLPNMVSGAIMASSSSKTPQMVQIAQAVELGLYQWLTACQVVGVGVGTLGVGVCNGTLVVVPNGTLMESAFKGNGLLGVLSPTLWVPIMLGISKTYPFVGESSLVGVGNFTGGFVGDPILLMQLLVSSFTGVGIVGVERVRLCTALSQGIYGHFQVSVGTGVIVGSASPSASSGLLKGNFV
jgi:hypothetical protein